MKLTHIQVFKKRMHEARIKCFCLQADPVLSLDVLQLGAFWRHGRQGVLWKHRVSGGCLGGANSRGHSGELDGTSRDECELGGASGDEGELDRTNSFCHRRQ